MGHLYHGYVSHNQRVQPLGYHVGPSAFLVDQLKACKKNQTYIHAYMIIHEWYDCICVSFYIAEIWRCCCALPSMSKKPVPIALIFLISAYNKLRVYLSHHAKLEIALYRYKYMLYKCMNIYTHIYIYRYTLYCNNIIPVSSYSHSTWRLIKCLKHRDLWPSACFWTS